MLILLFRCVRRSRIANTQMRCKGTAFFRIVQVFMLNLYKLLFYRACIKKCGMRNVKGKKIYTSQDMSDWNLYKVSVWMGRNLYKLVQI